MSNYNKYYDEHLNKSAAQKQQEKDTVDKNINSSISVLEENAAADTATAEQQYSTLFDQNNVQRIVNEKLIAESMANSGSTDSGLNRTQMTANQLSHANNDNALRLSKQQTVDGIARTLRANKTDLEISRTSQHQTIDNKYYDMADSYATGRVNADTAAAAEVEKAKITAQNELIKQERTDREKVFSALGNSNYTAAYKQMIWNNYKNTYEKTDEQMQDMFGSINTKYAYTTDEIESGVVNNGPLYTDEQISVAVNKFYGVNNKEEAIADYVLDLGSQNGWDKDTKEAFYNKILTNTQNSIKSMNSDPTTMKFTLVEDKGNHDGAVANDAIVRDENGKTWTIENVYYMIKHSLARQKYGNNWDSLTLEKRDELANKDDIKKEAKEKIMKIQSELGIKIKTPTTQAYAANNALSALWNRLF